MYNQALEIGYRRLVDALEIENEEWKEKNIELTMDRRRRACSLLL
jgi:hypothetical protein